MIIFELDDVLADTSHRRKYIEAPEDTCNLCYNILMDEQPHLRSRKCLCGKKPSSWKHSQKKYNNACVKDRVINETVHVLELLARGLTYDDNEPFVDYVGIEIWTTRCESTREKTEAWLRKYVRHMSTSRIVMKMRPIGDKTPNYFLKQIWYEDITIETKWGNRPKVEMVFARDPYEISMWRKMGVFVFDCRQKVL